MTQSILASKRLPPDSTILDFISQFRPACDVFLYGMCYWFAFILHNRFPESELMYDGLHNHFACRIDGVLYDAGGAITDGEFILWSEYQQYDPTHAARIERDCIRKERWHHA